jgi:hypothetical protein
MPFLHENRVSTLRALIATYLKAASGLFQIPHNTPACRNKYHPCPCGSAFVSALHFFGLSLRISPGWDRTRARLFPSLRRGGRFGNRKICRRTTARTKTGGASRNYIGLAKIAARIARGVPGGDTGSQGVTVFFSILTPNNGQLIFQALRSSLQSYLYLVS